jgi:RNA polymerase sigma-70 factor (ECF subfamily)
VGAVAVTGASSTLPDLYARHRAGIRRYLARMIGEADAEDVLHDVFERAQAAARDAEPSAGWLYRIARNAALDLLRGRAVREREAVRESHREEAPSETPDEDLARTRTRSCILGLVDQLTPAHREIVRLTELRGLSDREAAEALGITVGSAKIRLHRARRALRELMECECRTYRDQRNELACEPVRSSTLRVLT